VLASIDQDLKDIPYDFLTRYLGGSPLTITCTIASNGLSLTTDNALPDTGANGYLFVNATFAQKLQKYLQLETITGFTPHPVGGFDGKTTQYIDTALRGHLRIQQHLLRDTYFLVLDMKHEVIIGRKWFDLHDVKVDCRNRCLMFPEDWLPEPSTYEIPMDEAATSPPIHPSADALQRAAERDERLDADEQRRAAGKIRDPERAKVLDQVRRRLEELQRQKQKETTIEVAEPVLTCELPSASSLDYRRHAKDLKAPRSILKRADRSMKQMSRVIADELDASFESTDARSRRTADHTYVNLDIAMIGAAPLMTLARKTHLGVTSLYEIDRFIEEKKDERNREALADDTPELRRKAFEQVPSCYHDLLDGFSKVESDKLAPRRTYDHKIELEEGKHPEDLSYSPLYKMSLEELEACRKYITEHLDKGFIEASTAPWAAPILFARKANGGLRFCVDYRKLNAITRKDRYPLPLIEETLSRISHAKIFTKIDIRQAFHRVRMHPDAEELTTFRTRYGAYKYKVLPFGLTNGPSTFQRFINEVLMEYLDDFCSAYIDDILIFSDTEEEHKIHVRRVLERLRDAGLQPDLDKCEFHVTETKFLGFVIGKDGVTVDQGKIAVIRDWPVPSTVRGVQSFLGFCNFYRKFIRNYGRIGKALNNLTRKGRAFVWTEDCQEAFLELKARLLSAPLLRHFVAGRETRIETDASKDVLGGVLSQKDPEDGEWHPVAFFSSTMLDAETRYGIHDKELLAIIRALEHWRAELIGMQSQAFEIITDHQALEHFSTKRRLNSRQVRWTELLAQYHFFLTYRPGTQNAAADALSRKNEVSKTVKDKEEREKWITIFRRTYPDGEEGEQTNLMTLDAGRDDNTFIMNFDDVTVPSPSGIELTDALLRANQHDPSLEEYRVLARKGDDSVFDLRGDRYVTRHGKLIVPDTDNLRTKLLEDVHTRLPTGHPGRNKTRRLVSEQYWWKGISADVDRYVANCTVCRSSKTPRDKTPGLLHPLPVPLRTWQNIVVDFKDMPKDRSGYDNVLVVVDSLSKYCHSIPCLKTITAKETAMLYYEKGPYRTFGLPETITSDRGPQFIADFTNEVSKILGFRWKLSSSGHSQTAGQAEIMNQYINQRLRPYLNHAQDNWSIKLPAMDYIQNSLPQDSTNLSPHEILFGFPMPCSWDWEKRTDLADQDLTPRERLSREDAQAMMTTLKAYTDEARKNMTKAQHDMARKANRHRREPDFTVGDKVYIWKKVWSSSRPSDKLDFPMTRQCYKIKAVNGHSYQLEVPPGWRGTDTFHADRLRRYPDNPLPGQEPERPDGEVIFDDEPEWEVERVEATRLHYRKLQYQVQWKGWDPDPVYYDAANFKNAADKLRAFHEANPDAPGPPKRLAQWEKAAAEDREDLAHPDDNKPATGNEQLRRSGRRRRAI
jgi:hypothetical protein